MSAPTDARRTIAQVLAIADLAPDIRSFEIAPEGGALRYPAGAHIDVGVVVDGRPESRSYSLVGEPAADRYRIAVKRSADSRGGSAYMWSLEPGAMLSVSAPVSFFEIDLDRRDYLLIAGGIGVTPLVGMATLLARRNARLRLLYAARSARSLVFADAIRFALGDRLEIYAGDRGERIDLAAAIAALPADGLCAVCGPLAMIDDVRRLWTQAGRPAADLRWETFGSSGTRAAEAFRVVVPRHGVDVTVAPNRSMLDALTEAGVPIMSFCRKGECGLCETTVMSCDGAIDHRDVFLSDRQKADGHSLCVCVSRARGTLVLDSGFRADAG